MFGCVGLIVSCCIFVVLEAVFVGGTADIDLEVGFSLVVLV